VIRGLSDAGGWFTRLSRLVVEDNALLGLQIEGRYTVTHRLARGGMGEVFSARDLRLDRTVAMKLLGVRASRWAARFRVEVHTMTRLDHPGVVPIYDLGTLPDGRLFYTMKLVAGRTLEELMRSGEPRDRLVRRLAQAADVIDYAHDRGVLHRDLKPSNVMVDAAGSVFVMDWGVARVIAEAEEVDPEGPEQPGPGTQAGTILGTIEYMAPEQAQGSRDSVDGRADVFGLGAILYHILTGRPPVGGRTVEEKLSRSRAARVERPRTLDASLPLVLEAICLKALSANPRDRYGKAGELARDLRRYLGDDRVEAQPTAIARRGRRTFLRRPGVLVMIVSLLGLLASVPAWMRERSERRAKEEESGIVRAAGREREAELRELLGLWGEVVSSRAEWYQAHRDPRSTRSKIDASLRGLDSFLLKRPEHPQARFIRARARLSVDDLEGASQDLEEATRRAPSFGPAWALLGRVKIERYRQSYWSRVVHKERFDQSASCLSQAESAFEEARRAGAGRESIAAWGLEEMEEDGVSERITQALGIAYLQKDSGRARRLIEDAHAVNPSEEYANLLGFWSETTEARIRRQDEAIRIRPHYPAAYVDRALAKLEKDDFQGAIEDCSRALAVNPTFAEAYATRAHAREGTKDYSGVIRDATEALHLDPSHAGSLGCRAFAHWCRSEFDESVKDFSAALVLNPREPMLFYYRASGRIDAGDAQGAVDDATKALELDPNLECAYTLRAKVREKLGRMEEALGDYEKALQKAATESNRIQLRKWIDRLVARGTSRVVNR
jgi:serine/threonine protein kinase